MLRDTNRWRDTTYEMAAATARDLVNVRPQDTAESAYGLELNGGRSLSITIDNGTPDTLTVNVYIQQKPGGLWGLFQSYTVGMSVKATNTFAVDGYAVRVSGVSPAPGPVTCAATVQQG